MNDFTSSPGQPLPLGATVLGDSVNFSLFSRHATAVSLLLFEPGLGPKVAELLLDPERNRTGDIWHIRLHGLPLSWRYGFRVGGPSAPERGLRFRPDTILLDPYARALTGGSNWGEEYRRLGPPSPESDFLRRCCIINDDFDWEGDRPLNIPLKDSVIYEMHVRGFSRHPSSGVEHPGTYRGIIEKIPYLKELGVTAVELLPVGEFNENENINRDPTTGEKLKNFWGYSPIGFFAPKAAYAVSGRNGNQVREFKEMVKALHRAGIEVILDVVFNHTGEGNAQGPTLSFRGLDDAIYYLLDPKTGGYLNFSGCGNTLNCNHPIVRSFILDCLRYWVVEMHVDGFRFDLASILGRDRNGEVLADPPMVERIAEDPVLARTKLIAEAWDAAGLYQVGSFSQHPRWAEWNGRFRDDVRAFLTGTPGHVPVLATRLAGSSDLYRRSGFRPSNSINFVTSHDGFTLFDLVSYDHKHNLRNGEDNQDGCNHNLSWNSGVEGPSRRQAVTRLRQRRVRSFAVILFLSQGVPMLVAGDEFGRSQQGNNNAYCQDNELSWLDWRLAAKNHLLLRFFRLLIALRRAHPAFRRADFFHSGENAGFPEIRWQGTQSGVEDWSAEASVLAFFLDHRSAPGERDDFFVIFNGHRHAAEAVELPSSRPGFAWHLVIDTAAEPPADFLEEGCTLPITAKTVRIEPMAAMLLASRPAAPARETATVSATRTRRPPR